MDAIAPVGEMVQPPAPINGIGTLSSLYGLQQQRLGIQQQQQALSAQTAEAQQAQQKNRELQGLSQFTINAIKDPKYKNPDGSLNTQLFQQGAMAVAPTYGQPVIGQATSNAREAVTTQQAVQNLSDDTNKTITAGLQGLANLPGGATKSNLLDWIEQVESSNPNPTMRRAMNNLLTSAQPDQNGSYSGFAAKAAAALGGISMQQPGQMNLGGVVQPGTTTTMGPNVGQFNPVGQPVATVTPATNTPNAAGVITHIPTGGAGLPSTAGPPGAVGPTANPSNAQAQAQADDNTRYSQISNSAQLSETGQNLARNVALLAKGVQTGKFSGEVSDWLTTIRQHDPGLTDRQLLSKYAAQLQQTAIGAAGADTDQGRSLVVHGLPNPDNMSPDAIVDASRYIGGIFGMASARGQVASNYVKSHGGSPVGLRANVDDSFMANANPDVFAAKQIPAGQERQSWLTNHGYSDPAAKARLLSQIKALSQYGVQ